MGRLRAEGVPRRTGPRALPRKARTALGIALNEAARLGLLTGNPVARTIPPAYTPRQGMAWTAEETRRFVTVAQHDPSSLDYSQRR